MCIHEGLHMCACMKAYTCVHACRGQRLTLGVSLNRAPPFGGGGCQDLFVFLCTCYMHVCMQRPEEGTGFTGSGLQTMRPQT